MSHDDSREHQLEQVRALCVHAILRADEYAQRYELTPEKREEASRQLMEGGAHLQLTVRIDSDRMRAELRLVEFGEPKFPEPLLSVESRKGG